MVDMVAVAPKKRPTAAGFVHPRLASPVKPAPLAVSSNNQFFFLKNPNFGFGLAGAPPPAPSPAATHSRITAASHVI